MNTRKAYSKSWLVVFLPVIAFLPGCGKNSQSAINELLAYIPADTPVVMSMEINDRVLPGGLVDKYDHAFDAAVRFQRKRLKLAFEPMAQQTQESESEAAQDEVMAFIDRWMTAEKLRQMGFDPRDLAIALYTVDLVPVLRAKIASRPLTEQFMDELLALAGEAGQAADPHFDVKKTKNNGQVTYTVSFGGNHLVVHLASNQVVAALAPAVVLEDRFESILGLQKPDRPLAESPRLETFFSRYGYRPGQLFWVDWRQLVGFFVDPDNHPSVVLDHYRVGKNDLPLLCREEILELVGAFPRIVGGITEAGDRVLVNQVLWEMDTGVAQKLAAVDNEIPAFLPQARLGLGFSFDLPAIRQLAAEWALAVQNKPYQCDRLKGLNLLASAVQAKAMQPLSSFVSNFKGFSFSLEDWQLDLEGLGSNSAAMAPWMAAERLKSIRLAAGITFENPAALVGVVQLASAGLLRLHIEPNGKAVDLSQMSGWQALDLPASLEPAWVVMTGNKLMMTFGIDSPSVVENLVVGPGEKKALKGLIQAGYYQSLVNSLRSFFNQSARGAADRQRDELMLWADCLEAGLWWERQVIDVDFGDKGMEINVETVF